jgi:hypothetical protein
VNNLNAASEKLADAQARGDISAVIALQGALKFNGEEERGRRRKGRREGGKEGGSLYAREDNVG